MKKISPKRGQDLSGKKFGDLIAVKRGAPFYGEAGDMKTTWDCVCKCGKTVKNVVTRNLTRNPNKKCDHGGL